MRVGVFDSGIGGLTLVKSLMDMNSNFEIVYFADTIHMPYGNKSEDQVKNYVNDILRFMRSKCMDHIIAACGTISTILPKIDLSGKIIGVVVPSCISASKETKNGKIGILATSLAVDLGGYQEELLKINKSFQVFPLPCPNLASLIENGYENNDEIFEVLQKYLFSIVEQGIDTIILGCTHYPIVKNVITKMPNHIKIIDSSLETAKFIFNKFCKNNKKKVNTQKIDIYVSKLSSIFVHNANNILGFDVSNNIHWVSL